MNLQPLISIIIPVHNGSKYLSQCLHALLASSYQSYEIIVVDDASSDDSVDIAKKEGIAVIELADQSGPAGARNRGANQARGNILLFMDSDVIVRPDTVQRIASEFTKNPHISAVFGSYDDKPAHPDFLSQFRNLFHHFIHQNSEKEADTFWAGCGAIKRDIFLELGGFDAKRYLRPSIEDIELGLRLRKMGYRILLKKEIQVTHLKKWEWLSCIRTDILQRAIPWSQLILDSNKMPCDLNLRTSHRISAGLVGLLVLMIVLMVLNVLKLVDSIPSRTLAVAFFAFVLALIILNGKFYRFFLHKKGLKFTLLAIPTHFIYYFYSGLSFVLCWIFHKFPGLHLGWKKMSRRLGLFQ